MSFTAFEILDVDALNAEIAAIEADISAINADIADLQADVAALPQGVLGVDIRTANSGVTAAGSLFDFTVNVALVAGRLYEITLDTANGRQGSASGAVDLEVEHDGNTVARIFHQPGTSGEGALKHMQGRVLYAPSTSDASATFRLRNGAGSQTTVNLEANAVEQRSFAVFDRGALP